MKKIKGLILFTIFALVVLWNYDKVFEAIGFIWGVVLPFVIGGVVAFIVNIPMSFLEETLFGKAKQAKKKWALRLARPISLTITFILIVSLIAVVILIVVPSLGRTILNLGNTFEKVIPQLQAWLLDVFRENKEAVNWISRLEFDYDFMLKKIISFFQVGVGNIFDSTFAAAKSIVSGIVNFFIGVVLSCYILMQKEKLGKQVKKFMKAFIAEDWRNILLALGTVTHRSFANFFTGQCLEAVILGSLFLVVMAILRLPYAMLVSVLITFTALIPIFGSVVGCAVGTLLIFIVSPVKALVFLIVFLVLQQIEGNFIYPHVVGNSVGLPPIWVLVAVTTGANLMGIVGMLIFIPIMSVVYTMLRGIVNRRLGLKE